MRITRRTALTGTGFIALAGLLAACGAAKTESTDHTAADADHMGRNENGFQLNTVVKDAPVATLYTDFQCPYCKIAEPNFEEAARELDGVMNMTVKNLPLPMHANAVSAARAVMAAEQQGKRIAFTHKIFDQQDDWKNTSDPDALLEKYVSYAETIGLDLEKFRADFKNEKLHKIVEDEYAESLELGVRGTPSYLVDGVHAPELESSSSVDELVSTFKKMGGI